MLCPMRGSTAPQGGVPSPAHRPSLRHEEQGSAATIEDPWDRHPRGTRVVPTLRRKGDSEPHGLRIAAPLPLR